MLAELSLSKQAHDPWELDLDYLRNMERILCLAQTEQAEGRVTLAVPGGASPCHETFGCRRQSGLRTLAGPID